MAFKRKDTKETTETKSENTPVQAKVENQSTETPSVEPLVTSYTIVRQGGYWSVAEIVTQGDKVISRNFKEGVPKATAFLDFKMKFGRYFVGLE